MYELVKYFEKDNVSLFDPIQIVWEKEASTSSLAEKYLIESLLQNQSPFLSNITSEENFELPIKIINTINNTSTELGLSEEVKGDITKIITILFLRNPNTMLDISKSREGEFIAFTTTSNGTYKNLLIDEDGDIEIIIIPKDNYRTYNKQFYKADGINFSTVVSLFNGMS